MNETPVVDIFAEETPELIEVVIQGGQGPAGDPGPPGADGPPGPQGPSGVSNSVFTRVWTWNNSTNLPPNNTQVRSNTGDWATATELRIDDNDNDNIDRSVALAMVQTGDQVRLQMATDSTRYALFNVLAPAVDNAGYFTIQVAVGETGGVIPNSGTNITVSLITASSGAIDLTTPTTLTGLLFADGSTGFITVPGSDSVLVTTYSPHRNGQIRLWDHELAGYLSVTASNGWQFVGPVVGSGVGSFVTLAGDGGAVTGLSAGNIASGTVSPARLGGGSPSNTTFLRGDSNWAAVPPDNIDAILPSQTGNTGKFLVTNGSNSSWATAPGGGGATSFSAGGYASRPSASGLATGYVYAADDVDYKWVVNGANWDLIHPVYAPNARKIDTSGWTALNQSTETWTSVNGVLHVSNIPTVGSGEMLRGWQKAKPAAPFTLNVIVAVPPYYNQYQNIGFGFYDSVSGKIKLISIFSDNALKACGFNLTNVTTYSSDATTRWGIPGGGRYFWLRIVDNNTNWIYSISDNGKDYTTIGTEARNTFVTPDKVFIGFDYIQTSLSTLTGRWLAYWEEP